ncbi:hypothetical protein D3C80_1881920 [compost metagenome]
MIDLTGNPWSDFNGFRGFEAPGEFVPFIHRLFQHLGHADFGGLHAGGGFRGFTASAHHQHGKGREWIPQEFE